MTDGMTDHKPARVPARAHQRWHPPSAIDLADTESPRDILGNECEKPLPLARDPLTGKPDAGNPPVRFGGRGGALRHPYPYQADFAQYGAIILPCRKMAQLILYGGR